MGAAAKTSTDQRFAERIAEFRDVFTRAEAEVGRVIVGHQAAVRKVLTALFCGGHVLIEGVPASARP